MSYRQYHGYSLPLDHTGRGCGTDAMTAIALRQRKGHRTVTSAAILSGEDLQHCHRGGTRLSLEDGIVTVAAIEPLGMSPMGETNILGRTGAWHDDIEIEDFDLGIGVDVGPWFYITLL